jgi:cyclophilin family peptidyl-prolyl cis-trans isomerase
VRAYAARAAALMHGSAVLRGLAADSNHNVREAAIVGLSAVAKHGGDSIYLANLSSPGYQVVRSAAIALAGSSHPGAVPALLDALDRLTRERRENSRDPRAAILLRLTELGRTTDAPRLAPYAGDFDAMIAGQAAATLTKWTGTAVRPNPAPLATRAEPLGRTFAARGIRLKVTMAAPRGGGTWVVRLYPDEAPATVARVLRLVRARYYDGLTFHRVEPNFVIQGGSPDATEYYGDAAFMRDELGTRSHRRGTLGISTRGRDTGDAQWFVNLVDNIRLDHDYTVFGEIVSGMKVVDGILEGDAIARVEVLAGN